MAVLARDAVGRRARPLGMTIVARLCCWSLCALLALPGLTSASAAPGPADARVVHGRKARAKGKPRKLNKKAPKRRGRGADVAPPPPRPAGPAGDDDDADFAQRPAAPSPPPTPAVPPRAPAAPRVSADPPPPRAPAPRPTTSRPPGRTTVASRGGASATRGRARTVTREDLLRVQPATDSEVPEPLRPRLSKRPARPSQSRDPALWQRPWFWATVGGVAAVGLGVGLGVGLTRGGSSVPSDIQVFDAFLRAR